jgi:hypothetical protein
LRDNSPSNLSSPLSEPEDKDAYGDEADIDMRGHSDHDTTPNRNGVQDDPGSDAASESDDDSKLSELDVNDSEAETERLYDTPPKNGATRDIVNTAGDAGNRRFTDRRDRVFERSPSKLHQQLRADADAGDAASGRNSASEAEDGEDDDVSMPSSEPELDSLKGRALRSPTLVKKSQVVPSNAPTSHPRKNSADSRKRKRSSAAETSELEQPLKKRTGSISAADQESTGDLAMIDDDGISTNPQSANHTAEEDNEELVATTEAKEEAAEAAEEVDVPSRSRKGRRSPTKKQKSKTPEEASLKEEAPDEPPEDADVQSLEVPTPQAEDDHIDEVDEEAEAAHRNEEERTQLAIFPPTLTEANWTTVERKKAAWEELLAIEKQFHSFRERQVLEYPNVLDPCR